MQRSNSCPAPVQAAGSIRALRRWPLGLAVALVAVVTQASYAGGTNGGPSMGGHRGPDEDGGTVPATFQPPTGFHLVGLLPSIVELVQEARGTGTILVTPLDPQSPAGPVMVSFEGDFLLRLDRHELSKGTVGVLFGTDASFGAGWLQLTVGAHVGSPVQLPAGSLVGLPLGGLFAPGRPTGLELGLTAVGTAGAVLESRAFADEEIVTLAIRRSVAPSAQRR